VECLTHPFKTIVFLQCIPTYNELFVCDVGKQNWKKGFEQGKYHLLWRMIQFDHSMENCKDFKACECVKWGKKKSIYVYVMSDARSLEEVIGKLVED